MDWNFTLVFDSAAAGSQYFWASFSLVLDAIPIHYGEQMMIQTTQLGKACLDGIW
jgi:hypothetical protein